MDIYITCRYSELYAGLVKKADHVTNVHDYYHCHVSSSAQHVISYYINENIKIDQRYRLQNLLICDPKILEVRSQR